MKKDKKNEEQNNSASSPKQKTVRPEQAYSSDIYRSRPAPNVIPPRLHGRRVEQK